MGLFSEQPTEILALIIDQLETERDISVFTRLNRRLYGLFIFHLYQHNVKYSDSSALVFAARHGRLSTAQKAIQLGGADPNLIANDHSILSHAAEAGHPEICEFLLSHYHVNVNSVHLTNDFTPLLYAAIRGHASVVKILLSHGANPNLKERQGRSPLYAACIRGHAAVVDLLLAVPDLKLDDCIIDSRTPLLAAIAFRHESIALAVLDRGADPCIVLRRLRARNPTYAKAYGRPLFDTITQLHPQLDVLKRLLAWKGAQPNLLDPNVVIDGKTPLMEAVWLNCEGAVEILLEDPRVDADFALPVKGTTALMVAEIRGYRIIADLLLAHGADPDRADCTGITPRMMREVPSEKKLELVLEQSEKMCKVGDQLADERYKRARERLHRRVQERRRSRDQRRGLVS